MSTTEDQVVDTDELTPQEFQSDTTLVEAGVRAARSCFHAVRLGLGRMLR